MEVENLKKYLLFLCMVFVLVAVPMHTKAATTFNDVTNGTQKEIVRKITAAGIMSGYNNGMFKPSNTVTRAEMAEYIVKAYKLYNVRPATIFEDVATWHPNHDAIQAIYRAGIVDGSNGDFNPDRILKRAHVAKIFTNLLKLTPQTTTKFKDILTTDANNKYIGALVQREIIQGYPDGTFRPYESITRMQMATFLYRSLYGKEPTVAATKPTPAKPAPVKKTKITSNRSLAATKLASANYRIGLDVSENVHMKFLNNGNTNISEHSGDPYVYFFDDSVIICVMNNTDYYLLAEDLRGLEHDKTVHRKVDDEYFGYSYSLTATFNQQIRVNNMPFKEVIRVTYTDEFDKRMDFYFQEGYGLLRADIDGSKEWELMSYKVR